jgi:hypothetical protein
MTPLFSTSAGIARRVREFVTGRSSINRLPPIHLSVTSAFSAVIPIRFRATISKERMRSCGASSRYFPLGHEARGEIGRCWSSSSALFFSPWGVPPVSRRASYPNDQAFRDQDGPRNVLHCLATDKDDPTVMPRGGKSAGRRSWTKARCRRSRPCPMCPTCKTLASSASTT